MTRASLVRFGRNAVIAVGLWWGVSMLVVIAAADRPQRLHGGMTEIKPTLALTTPANASGASTVRQ